MGHTIDESVLIADLILTIQEYEKTPECDTSRRETLAKLILAYSNLLFAKRSPKENLQLIAEMRKLKEII